HFHANACALHTHHHQRSAFAAGCKAAASAVSAVRESGGSSSIGKLMRTTEAVLAALLAGPLLTAAHPLCFVDDRPTDPNQVLSFCPAAQDGACCTDQEEAEVQARFDAAGPLTGDCEDLHKQVTIRYPM
ncbi:unnamed protein product, partial [Scytosiphon promiscuus]